VSWVRKRSFTTRLVHSLLLALLLGVGSYYCPTPYQLMAPGPALDTRQLVEVTGTTTYASKGHLLLPTVIAEPANVLYCFYSLFDPAAKLIRADDGEELEGDRQMSLSQSLATMVALDHLPDLDPERVRGLRVLELLPGSPNGSRLQVGDILLSIQGQQLHHVRDLARFTRSGAVGSGFLAQVDRGGAVRPVALEVWSQSGRKMVGAVFVPALQEADSDISVKIQTERVSGASGGFVFALEILDQLTPADLTRGRVIAATGTLERRGTIGAIEGIAFKSVAAQRAGAQVFFCPKENLPELELHRGNLEIHGVSSLQEAIDILRR